MCLLAGRAIRQKPEGVVFAECFFVPEISGGRDRLDEFRYNYRHICRQKFSDDEPQPPQHKRKWYFVGSLKSVQTQSPNQSSHSYAEIEQSLTKFVYLRGTTVVFLLKPTNTEFKITFQSVQQLRAFYELIYDHVVLTRVTSAKIGVLHEIPIQEDGTLGEEKKLGNNIEAAGEKIDDRWYITFRHEQGEPVLIFSQNESLITGMRSRIFSSLKVQLLLQAHETFYVLTFAEYIEAKVFSDSLLGYLQLLSKTSLDVSYQKHLKCNSITINS